MLSISKDQSTELDFGTRKVPLYPDTAEEIKHLMQNTELVVTQIKEIKFATIVVAENESL